MTSSRPQGRPGSLLAMLDPPDRAALLRLGRPRHYRRGVHIIVQGDHSDTVSIVLNGRVKVTLDTPEGHEIVLAVLGAGDLLGEFEAVDDQPGPRTAGNVALEPVECLVITGDEFRQFLDSHPRVALVMLRAVLHRLRAADRRRIESGSLDTVHRLARFLLELAERDNPADSTPLDLDITLTQHELASLIASSRDSVVRALAALRSRGLISTARRTITIVDFDGLRRFAD